MNRRLKALVFAFFVVLATMAWTPCASAAIILDPSQLSQTPQINSSEMSVPVVPEDVPPPRFDRVRSAAAFLEGWLSPGGASAPQTTSSAKSVNAVGAVVAKVQLPPPSMIARLTTGSRLIFPDPPPFKVLHVPRRTPLFA